MPKIAIIIIIAVIILVGLGYGAYWYFGQQKPVACTQEAKLCSDGSSVGRTGPNCEFAPCPLGAYYDDLYKKCGSNECCIASVKNMAAGNYKLSETGGRCPDGFQSIGLYCMGSYEWCEPKNQ